MIWIIDKLEVDIYQKIINVQDVFQQQNKGRKKIILLTSDNHAKKGKKLVN